MEYRHYLYPMAIGLTAIIDWQSRHVLSWGISNTLDTSFCVEALEQALAINVSGIFNTEEGSQFTSLAFTQILLDKGLK